MKFLICLSSLVILTLLSNTPTVNAQTQPEIASLDTLLPTPFWLRSRAAELGVDDKTRADIEKAYQDLEPKYHELKKRVVQCNKRLNEGLTGEELDETTIHALMKELLEAESELKLYQTRVRVTLLSFLSKEQWRAAQELVKKKPEPDWQGVMKTKVERVRTLGEQLKTKGSAVLIAKPLYDIEKMISGGKIMAASRRLDNLIKELEAILATYE